MKKIFICFIILMMCGCNHVSDRMPKGVTLSLKNKELEVYKEYSIKDIIDSNVEISDSIIDTNSMAPTINIGDIVIVKKVEKEKLKQSDVITFSQEGEVITHRIIKVEADFKYVTKGDNNNTEDTKKVKYEDILGEEILIIPYLGKAIQIIDNKIIFLIICLIILICAFINIQKNEKLENRREKKKIEEKKKN